MGKQKKFVDYCADFETTVYDGQDNTAVWSAAFSQLYDGTEDVTVLNSLSDFMRHFMDLRKNVRIFFHNLKFDCSFIACWMLSDNRFREGNKYVDGYKKLKKSFELNHGEYTYLITAMGVWHEVVLNWRGCLIKFVDSLKLFPTSVRDIGESFKTKHRKLDMEYIGFRYPGCPITKEELKYIKNDVLVVKEALEYFFSQGHKKSTIASCCMDDFKKRLGDDFDTFFPDIYDVEISDKYGQVNAGEYIHKSYHGGWCYVMPNKSGKVIKNGYTLDVNSLYPSVMHSKSGNRYPVGQPTFFTGDKLLDIPNDCYYFVRIKCRFNLKSGYLPFIQIKGTLDYRGNEMLKTSDIFNTKTGEYSKYDNDNDGNLHTVELTMTQDDYQLFLEHYDTDYFEILDGCYFRTEIGIFDDYIDYYYDIKQNSAGAKRTIAKLFLNGLYGRFAMYVDSSYKLIYLDNGVLQMQTVEERDKKPGYIPVGSVIVSKARCFTIRAAQKNYDNFIYADTDSLHLSGTIDNAKGVTIDNKNLLCWKNEGEWTAGIFVRQKAYIEVIDDNLDIKCSGLNNKCKDIINFAWQYDMGYITDTDLDKIIVDNKYNNYQADFLKNGFKLSDFKPGLKVFGNLKAKRIKGGTVLKEDWFNLRQSVGLFMR